MSINAIKYAIAVKSGFHGLKYTIYTHLYLKHLMYIKKEYQTKYEILLLSSNKYLLLSLYKYPQQ